MSESTKSSMFTEEQRLRIAANHARALQLKEARLKREAAAAQAPTALRPPQPMKAPNSSQSQNTFRPPQPMKALNSSQSQTTFHPPQPMKAPNSSQSQTTSRPVEVKYARKDEINPNIPSTSSLQQVEVTAALISFKRFKVTYFPVRDALVEVCRSLNTRVYDRDMKAWHFALSDYKQAGLSFLTCCVVLIAQCRPVAEVAFKAVKTLNVTFKGFDETVKKIFQSDIDGQATNQVVLTPPDLSKIDSSLLDKVFPFQRAGIIFGVQKNGRALIADEMGLGKTVQALGIARYFKNEWPLLIICPSSVKFAWSTQIGKFLPSVASQVSVIEKSGDVLPDRRTSDTIVIISYDQMSTRIAQLVKFGFRVVIFDESHMIKDSKAKRTLSAHQLTKGATRVLLLSGTPALSRPAELFNQIKAVSPDLFRNFVSFAVRYCDGRQGRFAFEAKGATNTEELAAILEKTIMIRRLKKDVLDDLPEKRREMVVIGGNAIKDKMKLLQQAEQSCLSARDTQERKKKLVEYFSMTGSAKASTVAKHIVDEFFVEGSDERKDDRKVLVFAHHQVVIDTIALEMAKRSLKTIRIDGTTPSKKREELCQHFQTNADCSVALLSITAAGVGITLTAASLVIFAELHWNPGTLVQAEDRAHRMGQKDSVHVQYIVASGTADDHIWPLIQRKLDVLTSVKLSSDSFREADSRSVHTTAVSSNQPTLDSFFGALVAEDSAAEPDAKRFRSDLNGSQIC